MTIDTIDCMDNALTSTHVRLSSTPLTLLIYFQLAIMLKNDTDHNSPSSGKENSNPVLLRRSKRNRPAQRSNFPAGKSDSVLPPLSHDSLILEIWTKNPSSLSGEPIARKKSKKNHDRPETDNLLANPPPADEAPTINLRSDVASPSTDDGATASDQRAHPLQDDNGNINHPGLNQIDQNDLARQYRPLFLAVQAIRETMLESVQALDDMEAIVVSKRTMLMESMANAMACVDRLGVREDLLEAWIQKEIVEYENAIADMSKTLEYIAYVQQAMNRLANHIGRVDES
jgi:hypothetical protein